MFVVLIICECPRGLTGKTVKNRRGPAAVTEDENRNNATVRMDGKARQVERTKARRPVPEQEMNPYPSREERRENEKNFFNSAWIGFIVF